MTPAPTWARHWLHTSSASRPPATSERAPQLRQVVCTQILRDRTFQIAAAIWKILSLRIWVHTTCRGCGTRSLVAGARDSLGLCNQCRSQTGTGLKAGGERDRRVQWIGMHRRYVRISSDLVPGSGALWAGKAIRTLLLGVVLALSLGGLSASAGPGEGGAIVTELRRAVTAWAAAVSGCVWLVGAAWGVRSFDRFQARYNVGTGRS